MENLNLIFKKNKIFRETFWAFMTQGSTFLLYFSINVYLARALGIEKFGIWSFFFSIFTIILLLPNAGINNSIKKYVAQYNKTEKINAVLKSSVKLRFISSLIFIVLFFLIHKQLAEFINRPEFASLFLFSIPLILLSTFLEFLKKVFIGLHKIKYNFIINLLEYGLKLLLVVLFLTVSLELLDIINAFTVAVFVASVAGSYFLYKDFYLKNKTNGKEDFTKDILKYSLPLFFASIGFLAATEIDILMLGLLATNTEVGIYSIAKQVIAKLPHISIIIVMGTMPMFAKLNKNNKRELKKLFYKLLKINATLLFVMVSVILLFSGVFVPLIFGLEYTASVLPLQILTIYLVCFSTTMFFGSFLDYQGLAKKRAINLSISVVLNIFLNLILIPTYGAIGAAIGTSVSYLPYVLLNWLEVKKVLKKEIAV